MSGFLIDKRDERDDDSVRTELQSYRCHRQRTSTKYKKSRGLLQRTIREEEIQQPEKKKNSKKNVRV